MKKQQNFDKKVQSTIPSAKRNLSAKAMQARQNDFNDDNLVTWKGERNRAFNLSQLSEQPIDCQYLFFAIQIARNHKIQAYHRSHEEQKKLLDIRMIHEKNVRDFKKKSTITLQSLKQELVQLETKVKKEIKDIRAKLIIKV